MACCEEDSTLCKMRACNSVIRNQNHILKCTLKTLLDNPSRTRDRALCSLIGLCRKQCNGPIVRLRPRKVISMPTIVPTEYTPICPPPIVIKKKKSSALQIEEKAGQEKPRAFSKTRNKIFQKRSIKPTGVSDYRSSNQRYSMGCSPPLRGASPQDRIKASGFSRGFGMSSFGDYSNATRKSGAKNDRCSRRCCLPQKSNPAAPLTMSPLCCPPSVKALSPKPTNKTKCTTIVRSFRCTPPPVGTARNRQQDRKRQSNSPMRNQATRSSRPSSAPEPARGIRNDICKSNMTYGSYFSNFCRNNNDSEVDPPGVYTSHPSEQRPSNMWARACVVYESSQEQDEVNGRSIPCRETWLCVPMAGSNRCGGYTPSGWSKLLKKSQEVSSDPLTMRDLSTSVTPGVSLRCKCLPKPRPCPPCPHLCPVRSLPPGLRPYTPCCPLYFPTTICTPTAISTSASARADTSAMNYKSCGSMGVSNSCKTSAITVPPYKPKYTSMSTPFYCNGMPQPSASVPGALPKIDAILKEDSIYSPTRGTLSR
ncbi:hypothetical protein ElyMa_004087900 [Elysia marginata]|uniref:Uncharacterized protein n=1 Tax=Elysia marginata TaxID=1093978 RepID=A0AAV4G8K4_9GAST|nr:hypothetical protein ElyMa_004087900 [Elysia marginata]